MKPEEQEQWRMPQQVQTQAPYQPSTEQQQPPQPSPEVISEQQPQVIVDPSVAPVKPPAAQASDDDAALLRWQATEYIQHDRTKGWYIGFGIVILVLMALAIFLIKSITFAVLIPVMAAALFVYTRRQPAILDYTLTKKGLYINDKVYPYSNFKSFSIVSHAGHNTAQLAPRKRFQLGQSVYFPDEVGESLVDMLAARLPMQQARPDLYDRIISKLKI